MMSSTVSFATRKCTFTAFACPILCARSSACTMSPGVQESSPKITVDAAVSVSPIPAALMDSTATLAFRSVWKRSTRLCRAFVSVEPSMRMNGNFRRRSISEAASRVQVWWRRTGTFRPRRRRRPGSPSCPGASRGTPPPAWSRPAAWYSSFISRFSSRVRPPPPPPPSKSSLSSSIFARIARTRVSAAECGRESATRSQLFAGNCVRTSF